MSPNRPNMISPFTSTNSPVTVAVANAKGGVGKTSIVANLAGQAAVSGLRVLAIDLDPQGNLATDLGYKARSDLGRGLADLFRGIGLPETLTNVREGLDVWAGGPIVANSMLSTLIPHEAHPLAAAISEVGDSYDAVFIDCPPALGPLVDAALVSSDFLIVPIRADHASLDGLGLISERFAYARGENSCLELLGITIFGVSRSATALAEDLSRALRSGFPDVELRVLPAVRRSERAAYEMRANGLLSNEYARRLHHQRAADNLAADYEALADRVIEAIKLRTASGRATVSASVAAKPWTGVERRAGLPPAAVGAGIEAVGSDYEPRSFRLGQA